MRRVRVASVPLWQAQLLKSALTEADIDAEITGEALGSLTGAIPIGSELPAVLVDEANAERAREVIRDMTELQAHTGTRTCAKCSEENPANFASCWSCGAALDSTPVSSEKRDATSAPPMPASRAPMVLSILFAASTAVLAVMLWQSSQTVEWNEAHYGRWKQTDADCQVLTVQGRKRSITCDFNHDGFFEIQKDFDREERIAMIWRDTNANRIFDEGQGLDVTGRPTSTLFDRDEDGRYEERLTLDAHGKPLSRMYEIRKNGVELRVETLDESGVVLSESTTNTDGSWTLNEKSARVWRGSSARFPAEELTITTDGGVRKQRLTQSGWVDEP